MVFSKNWAIHLFGAKGMFLYAFKNLVERQSNISLYSDFCWNLEDVSLQNF